MNALPSPLRNPTNRQHTATAPRPPTRSAASPSTIHSIVLWDLDNVRPPADVDPASLLQAVAARAAGKGGSDGSTPSSISITLYANSATSAALPPGWDPPPGGAALVTLPSRPGAVDQAITTAAFGFVTSTAAASSSSSSLTVVSSDAAAFTGLIKWARSAGNCRTCVIGSFPTARGRADAWRARPLPAAADEAWQWGEVVRGLGG